jgi:hypothetical protein
LKHHNWHILERIKLSVSVLAFFQMLNLETTLTDSLNPLPNKPRGLTTDSLGLIAGTLIADSISMDDRQELNLHNRSGELEIAHEKLLTLAWTFSYFELVNGILYQYEDEVKHCF